MILYSYRGFTVFSDRQLEWGRDMSDSRQAAISAKLVKLLLPWLVALQGSK